MKVSLQRQNKPFKYNGNNGNSYDSFSPQEIKTIINIQVDFIEKHFVLGCDVLAINLVDNLDQGNCVYSPKRTPNIQYHDM
ncbi:hypothetical protein ACHAXS_009023, partial [Conticribra weissflogii]